ncbi:MAG: DUF4386 domain-containing protein [Trueperaceae bacterium]|nr:DUF4386 domain-containing protein [Trueperaceae bacterium]
MTKPFRTLSIAATARLAGVCYLILAICGAFAEFGVRQRLIVPGEAAATAQKLLDNAGLFRLGIVAELLGQVVFVFLVLALFDLFKVVHRRRAVLMVVLVLLAVGLTALNLVKQGAALFVLDGGAWTAAFEPAQREALASLFLDLHGFGYGVVALVFFGLRLLPLGALIVRSGFVPEVAGWLVALAGVGYLVDVLIATLAPNVGFVLSEFTFVGELLLMGWLLAKGVNVDAWRTRYAQALTEPA